MKKCEDPVVEAPEKQGYPEVVPGDTVQNPKGEVYLVCTNTRKDHWYLQRLENGNVWSSNTLWGSFWEPEDWTKVDMCFKPCEPTSSKDSR